MLSYIREFFTAGKGAPLRRTGVFRRGPAPAEDPQRGAMSFMFSRVLSLGIFGLDGYAVAAEADTSNGLPAFEIVGLPDAAVSESRGRVRSAIKNSGFTFPVSRITVNLAPADKRKTGPVYDLPILLAVLAASGQIDPPPRESAFLGELSLDGMVRPVNGALCMASAAASAGIERLYVPRENAPEAALAAGVEVFGVGSVRECIDILRGSESARRCEPMPFVEGAGDFSVDFSDVKGQASARRAAEIAAAGGHNLLMIGPPGTGKSMIAKRIPTILPPLGYDEAVETTKIYSAAGRLQNRESLISLRPFRAPHHTVSAAALTGGGSLPHPGEISLAHNGVLFLDELPEFSREATEVLRQPLEDGRVTISRVAGALTYPCDVMLVAAMNPCRCGNFGSRTKPCTCTPGAVDRYLSRISGPLLDRLDIHAEVAEVDYEDISDTSPAESSAAIRERVKAARAVQGRRYAGRGFSLNAALPSALTAEVCRLTEGAERTIKAAFSSLGLSARAYDKVLRVSRTIADLEGSERVDARHVAEAVSFRALDKKYWRR